MENTNTNTKLDFRTRHRLAKLCIQCNNPSHKAGLCEAHYAINKSRSNKTGKASYRKKREAEGKPVKETTCRKCGQAGHNARTCASPPVAEGAPLTSAQILARVKRALPAGVTVQDLLAILRNEPVEEPSK